MAVDDNETLDHLLSVVEPYCNMIELDGRHKM